MFGYIPNIVSFFDFEGLICVFREVYFRFKGLVIRQTPSIKASRQRHSAVFTPRILGHQPLETEVDLRRMPNQPLETEIGMSRCPNQLLTILMRLIAALI